MERLGQSKSLADRAYEAIRNAVCDGTFRPGERITQEEVADRLDVSRQPVIHALALLKAQGFLLDTGRRGLTVAPVTQNLVENIYQFRSAVEPLAVRLATERRSARAIHELRAVVAEGRRAAAERNGKAALEADMRFHQLIYGLSGNPLIVDAMEINWQHLRRGMVEVLRCPGLSSAVWEQHGRILDAMREGDAARAAALMHDHVVDAHDRLRA